MDLNVYYRVTKQDKTIKTNLTLILASMRKKMVEYIDKFVEIRTKHIFRYVIKGSHGDEGIKLGHEDYKGSKYRQVF